MKNDKIKKILDIGTNVLLYLFLAICIFSLGLTIFAKKDSDGTPEIFGYQLRIVITESMAECDETDVSEYDIKSIPLRSMVFVETVPKDEEEAKAWYDELKVGDVLTFKYTYASQVTITHRIISIEPKGDGYIIKLAGDNTASVDNQGIQTINTNEAEFSTNYIVGKVVGQAKLLGFILSIMKEPAGLIFIIIIPCAIVIIMEIIKISNVVNAEKKQKTDEENKKKDDELEELRRRLAALESVNTPPPAPESKPEPVVETPAEVAEETHEVAEESSEVAEESPEVAEESHEVAEESPEVAEESHEVAEESHEATEESHEVAEESPEVAEESPEVAEESSKVAEETREVTEESHEVAEESHEVTEESHEVAEESHEVAEESHEVAEESPEVAEESHEVVEKTENEG